MNRGNKNDHRGSLNNKNPKRPDRKLSPPKRSTDGRRDKSPQRSKRSPVQHPRDRNSNTGRPPRRRSPPGDKPQRNDAFSGRDRSPFRSRNTGPRASNNVRNYDNASKDRRSRSPARRDGRHRQRKSNSPFFEMNDIRNQDNSFMQMQHDFEQLPTEPAYEGNKFNLNDNFTFRNDVPNVEHSYPNNFSFIEPAKEFYNERPLYSEEVQLQFIERDQPEYMDRRVIPQGFADREHQSEFSERNYSGDNSQRFADREPQFIEKDHDHNRHHHQRRFVERESQSFVEYSNRDEAPRKFKDEPVPREDEIRVFSGEEHQSARDWLQEIDEYGDRFGWNDKIKIFHMTSKLNGFARSWYIGLENTNINWDEWKEKLIKAFPCDQDYDKLLVQMMERKKKDNETYDKYFCHKVAMLNGCDITGRRAVSCVLNGISNQEIVKDAKKANFENTEQLYEFLCSVQHLDDKNVSAADKVKNVDKEVATKEEGRKSPGLRRRRRKGTACLNCREDGHDLQECPRLSSKKKNELQASSKAAESDEISDTFIMYGAFKRTTCYKKNFVDVLVNGTVLNGYVDINSDHVTIRQEVAFNLNLPVRKYYKIIRSFGNSNIAIHGEVEVTLSVGSARANVLACIIPDHIQAIAVIVGKSFLQLPNVYFSDRGNKVQITHFNR